MKYKYRPHSSQSMNGELPAVVTGNITADLKRLRKEMPGIGRWRRQSLVKKT